MKYGRFILIPLATLVLSVFVACKKDHRVLGTEASPLEDDLDAIQLSNLPVAAYSKSYTSVVSLNTDVKYLGANQDGITGKLEVGLYTNANLSKTNVTFSNTAVLVSSEIVLVVNSPMVLGRLASALNYSVYTLDSTLNSKRAYYTNNSNLHNTSSVIGGATTSYTTYGSKLAIRIPIDAAYANSLMQNTAALVSNETFQAAYKGFYIKANTMGDDGVIYECLLSDDVSGFYIHYKSAPTETVTTDLKFSFTGTGVARFNTAKFTPVSALNTQFSGDTAQGANGIYLRGMGGSKAIVRVPFLKNYGDTFDVSVNRAEVIFNLDASMISSISGSDTTVKYRTPPKLALLALDSLGKEALMLDQKNTTYISRYDGVYDNTNKRYVFNIPLHAQAILQGRLKNYGFTLVVADTDPILVPFRDQNVEGTLLQGANGAIKPIFNISYIRLRNE